MLIVGQEHYNPIITKDGPNYKGFDKDQSPTLPDAQADIYHIIRTLRSRAGLQLVVGEGLGPNPLGITADETKRYRADMDPRAFLAAHPTELGYTLAADAFEDILVIGVDDKKEMDALADLDRERFALDSQHLERINRTPTRDLFRAWQEAKRPFQERQKALNARRSSLYLNGALNLMTQRRAVLCVCVIGAAHVQEMVDEYLQSRNTTTLYTARPRHCGSSDP